MKLEIVATIVEGMMKVIEKFETSSKFNHLIWAIVAIFAIYAFSSLLQGVGAVRWW